MWENQRKKDIMTSCKECEHIGNYTDGVYSRNPHYCCELIWELFEEDYKVDPDTIDEKCPLKNIDIDILKEKFYVKNGD